MSAADLKAAAWRLKRELHGRAWVSVGVGRIVVDTAMSVGEWWIAFGPHPSRWEGEDVEWRFGNVHRPPVKEESP